MTDRRRFIATAGGMVAAAAAAIVDATLDWHQGVAERLAKVVGAYHRLVAE